MTARPTSERTGWLLLQLRLPRGTSSRRVAVWRRLRKLEAAGLAGAIYALPEGPESRESFEWLRRDVAALGGEARLFEAHELPAAPPGRPAALTRLDPKAFRGRSWVTRPRPGVDRMASAWLIRSFVDPKARFAFAAEGSRPPRRAIPFDTFGAELGHQQGLCTFEVLARRFRIERPAVRRLAKFVHALDLDEEPPERNESALIERLVEGLRASHADNGELLEAGIALFAALAASTRERPVGAKKPSPKHRKGVRR
jgi:hypothetical protein